MASYAVQAKERLPIESTNVLIAGALHFVVYVDAVDEGSSPCRSDLDYLRWSLRAEHERRRRGELSFDAIRRRRFVASVREVVDAEGLQVISNEVYRAGRFSDAAVGAPLRSSTLEELVAHGFEPATPRCDSTTWP